MQEPIKALSNPTSRTKARDYKSYRETMELKANSSNNTIFADADGDIAYFHGNFIPRRDTKFDWTKPVDGSDPETEWHGLLYGGRDSAPVESEKRLALQLEQLAVVGCGPEQPETEDYPRYVENGGESARGLHAIRVLENKKDFTLDSLMAAAYDSYLTVVRQAHARADQGVGRCACFESAESETRRADRGAAHLGSIAGRSISVPTSLAIFWGEDVQRRSGARAARAASSPEDYLGARRRRAAACSRSQPPPTNSPPTSARGRRRGAISIVSSA